MKKSDIAMIVLIAGVSMLVAYAVANQIPFLKPPEKGETVKTTEKITANLDTTNLDAIFNENAINPSVQTVIGH